jgi:toxin HigB-1
MPNMAIKTWACKDTEALFSGVPREIVPQKIQRRALAKLVMLHAAADLKDLTIPPSNRLEKLKGDRAGQYSIRINDQYRVCFNWHDRDAYDVEIVDYH